jgi:hypothetical protein
MKTKHKSSFKTGTPDLKYYAFDWDDNLVHMPTKIILLDVDGNEVSMSTEDFATFRGQIGKENFKYNGNIIADFAPKPFRFFGVDGYKDFLVDAMKAKIGPAWNDFKEAVNNGSIFAIITARGHNPETIKQGVYNYINSNFGGISKKELVKNLKKYRDFVGEEKMSDEDLIWSYLELNRYNPVSFGVEEEAANPEEAKVLAMANFVKYVKSLALILQKSAFLKKGVANKFIPKKPTIGFSDDDLKNLEKMYKHYKDKPDNIVKSYFTGKGKKELRK